MHAIMENYETLTLVYNNSNISYEGTQSNDSEDDWVYTLDTLPEKRIIILSIIFGASILVSAVGNVSAIVMLTRRKGHKNSLYSLLMNLAIADWSMSILCLPFLFASTMSVEWVFGAFFCTLIPFALKISEIVSIFTLVVIGIDRYHAVMYPLKRRITSRQKTAMLVLIWIVAILLSCPKPVFSLLVGYPVKGNRTAYVCTERWPVSSYWNLTKLYIWLLFIVTYLVPLAIITGCYLRVAFRLWNRRLPGQANVVRDKEHEQTKRKLKYEQLYDGEQSLIVCLMRRNPRSQDLVYGRIELAR
ncbi:tachykinin-like peptides receptor 99D [Saccoglossus kowalevskii]|uniref:Tachykinin-like peptides receptor 99D-like n=1 Tax=Saccoglossus kowalevskii TaxID=10224 RepID=A0ABM0MT64_SACKO|nr:PREDICTED: tachykinin-like peptides receptor 99D-like [Saccoglossus kowalevskii]